MAYLKIQPKYGKNIFEQESDAAMPKPAYDAQSKNWLPLPMVFFR
jgi:hypothetical protein